MRVVTQLQFPTVFNTQTLADPALPAVFPLAEELSGTDNITVKGAVSRIAAPAPHNHTAPTPLHQHHN